MRILVNGAAMNAATNWRVPMPSMPEPTDKYDAINELQDLLSESINDHGDALGEDFLSVLAFDIVDQLPITFLVQLVADRIDQLAEQGIDEIRGDVIEELNKGFFGLVAGALAPAGEGK